MDASTVAPRLLRISAAASTPPRALFFSFVGARQNLAQHFVQIAHRRRLHALQSGNAQHDVVAQPLSQLPQHLTRLVRIEVYQNGGDDLRMLAFDQLGHRGRVHPFEALDTGVVVVRQDAVDQRAGFVVAQCAGQNITQILIGFRSDRGVLLRLLVELAQHARHLIARDVAELRHRDPELLHLARAEMLEHLHRLFLAERHQEDRAALYSVFAHSPPTQSFTTLATMRGS